MPDKKLTDNDIIKALECCQYGMPCERCPYDGLEFCRGELAEDARFLINRQKAENERLKEEVAKEFTCFVGDPHKVEHCPYLEQVETAKAEAYKNFAYDLKQIPREYVYKWEIDNLLKEKLGEKTPLNDVKCIDCEYLEFELPYAVCSKAYKGIVQPNDSCGMGKLKEKAGNDAN